MMRFIGLIVVTLGLGTLAAAASAADGEQVFLFYCAQCHGTGRKGDGPNVTKFLPVSPRDFTDAVEMNKLTDAHMAQVIRDGGPAISKSAMMPGWVDTLNDEEIAVLVTHIRKLCDCPGKQE